MADVAADLRAALLRALGPLDVDTLQLYVLDPATVTAIGDEATKRLHTVTDEADRCRLIGTRSVTHRVLGNLDGALTDAKAAVEIAERVGTELLLSPSRARLAQVMRIKGEFETADRLFALAEAGELPPRLIGRVRVWSAVSCVVQGRLTEALLHLERAIEYTSDEFTTAIADTTLELVYRLAGKGFGPSPRPWEERACYPAPRRFQDPRNGKWGFLDSDQRACVPATFIEAGEFRAGIAAVRERNWGAIDTNGAISVPFLYDEINTVLPDGRNIMGFVDGVAVVSRRGAKGIINRGGKVILPLHHRGIVVHPAGYAIDTGSATWGARDHKGDEIVAARYSRADVLRRLDTLVLVDDGPL